MNKLLEMKQQRAALIDGALAIVDAATEAKRDLTQEELADIAKNESKAEEMRKAIEVLERVESQRSNIHSDNAVGSRRAAEVHDRREDKPFGTFGEQIQACIRAARNPAEIDVRLRNLQERGGIGSNESVGSDGGFLVQKDFGTDLLQIMHTSGAIVSRVRKVEISSNSNGLKMNGIDETSRADGSRWGGIQAYWKDEGALKTGSKPKFRQLELNLKKLTGLHYMTDELMQDASALESWSKMAFAEEFAFKVDDAILFGEGQDKPLGFIGHASNVVVAKVTGQQAASITFENIVRMYSRLWARSRPNAVWLVNQDAEPQLATMTLEVGTGGAPAYLPPGGLSQTPYATLLGRPIIPIEQASSIGTAGDIILADLSQYLLIEKGGMQTAVSMHVRFEYDETVLRFVYRVDGQPMWRTALTPYKGSTNTLSPFVTLATRA